jgi:hypothetical protein
VAESDVSQFDTVNVDGSDPGAYLYALCRVLPERWDEIIIRRGKPLRVRGIGGAAVVPPMAVSDPDVLLRLDEEEGGVRVYEPSNPYLPQLLGLPVTPTTSALCAAASYFRAMYLVTARGLHARFIIVRSGGKKILRQWLSLPPGVPVTSVLGAQVLEADEAVTPESAILIGVPTALSPLEDARYGVRVYLGE